MIWKYAIYNKPNTPHYSGCYSRKLKRFAWLPIKIEASIIWLEYYYLNQSCVTIWKNYKLKDWWYTNHKSLR